MVFFLETELIEKYKLLKSLKNIHGINTKRSSDLCKKLGLADNFKVKRLTKKYMNSLGKHIERSGILIGNDLKKQQLTIFKNQFAINSRRGIRKSQKLPVRGQRTHTNARTVKKLKNI